MIISSIVNIFIKNKFLSLKLMGNNYFLFFILWTKICFFPDLLLYGDQNFYLLFIYY